MDWIACAVVETVPGRVSGQPVIKGTRVRPDDLVVNRTMGEEWLSDAFALPLDVVREVLAFYDAHTRRP
jgi:uncharacterized protein (DUF433 family)